MMIIVPNLDVPGPTVPRFAASVEELLAATERREPFVNPDGRSTAGFVVRHPPGL